MRTIVHQMTGQAASVRQLAELKQHARATWAAGDYEGTAGRELRPLGARIVRDAGVAPGERVLDIACGTGNAALEAARAGAGVVGLDIAPELVAVGKGMARDAGLEVEWVEGDAEALPFEEATFDVALSVMGVMFAPRHEVAARELARVLRPGGRAVVFAWTPEGRMGRLFGIVGGFLPAGPEFALPPTLWGLEEHVRALLEPAEMDVEFRRDNLISPSRFDSTDEEIEFLSRRFGPFMGARAYTEAAGTWAELRAALVAHLQEEGPFEYLVTLARRRPSG